MISKRQARHLALGLVTGGTVVTIYFLLGFSTERWLDSQELKAAGFKWRLSMSLAYAALLFLVATLAIGPWHVLRRATRPANIMLRRDFGIWTGILALSHASVGMLVHVTGLKVWSLFVTGRPGPGNWLPLRASWFGLANYAGLAQAAIFVVLLLISNNVALRRLGVKRWKAAQRLTYVAVVSIVIHALSYQAVEFRSGTLRFTFLVLVSSALLLQIMGFVSVRRRKRRHNRVV